MTATTTAAAQRGPVDHLDEPEFWRSFATVAATTPMYDVTEHARVEGVNPRRAVAKVAAFLPFVAR